MIDQTVYIVDDDEAMRDSLEWLLESAGINVETFGSALVFLEKIKLEYNDEWAQYKPCCLITDVCMPGMSGLELQDELIASGIPLPIIIITGHGNETMAADVLNKGAIEFFNKPFSGEALLKRINVALERPKTEDL